MNLGDSFSHEEKLESFRRQFHAGRIFYLFCTFTSRPKEKYLLLACVSPRPVFFVINTEITQFKQRLAHLRDRQVLIMQSEYEFLDHDSYIDCTEAIESLLEEDIKTQVLGDMRRVKGELNDTSIEEVIKSVEAARTLTLRQKKWVLKELSEKIGKVY